MLVSFAVENYLSIKDRLRIDFTADSIKEKKESQFSPYPGMKVALLKSLAIFGSNNSGKSNIFRALSFVRDFILHSQKETHSNQPIPAEPFALSSKTASAPSFFEAVFYIDRQKYRYGFAVTPKYVHSEWLFVTDKRKEEKLFIRARQDYSFEKAFKGGLKGKFELFAEVTRPNTLFLSVLAQFNSTICVKISEWFSNIHIANDRDHWSLIDYTATLMATSDYRRLVNEVFLKTDLGIERVEERLVNSLRSGASFYDLVRAIGDPSMMSYVVKTSHKKFDDNDKVNGTEVFELLKNESLGTQRFFGILGPILESLKEGKILFIDELDSHLHTILLEVIIGLFNSEKFNPNGAQIVFSSHNLNPLKKALRRDQILLIKKDDLGGSILASLHESHPQVRNDTSIEKNYLLGKFEGIPKINTQMNLFDSPFEED